MINILYITLEFFFVYSFLGWCTEVAYQAMKKGLIVNRGFLNGPVCPIYGFGVLAVFRMLEAAGEGNLETQNAFKVFLFGVVLSTAIELLGGWMLDKIFHARWWDYSKQPFNLHGYICLEFSIIWGLGILLVVRGVNPMITHVLGMVPRNVGWVLIAIFSVVFIADVIISVMVMVGLNKRLAELDEMRERMRIVSNNLSEKIGTHALETMQQVDEARVQATLARTEFKEQAAQAKAELQGQAALLRDEYEARKQELADGRKELMKRIESSRHFGTGRLLRAFPDMQHRQYREMFQMLIEEMRNMR